MMIKRVSFLLSAGFVCAGLSTSAQATTTLSGTVAVDNAFFAYLSPTPGTLGAAPGSFGTLIASGSGWNPTVSFSGAPLNAGVNYLNIEVINTPGSFPTNPGGLIASFTYGGQTLLTNTTQWTAIYNDANGTIAAQNWVPTGSGAVKSLGLNGVAPWNTIPGVGSSAEWIDAASNGLNTSACENFGCTVDFSAVINVASAPGPNPGAGLAGLAALLLAAGYAKARAFRA